MCRITVKHTLRFAVGVYLIIAWTYSSGERVCLRCDIPWVFCLERDVEFPTVRMKLKTSHSYSPLTVTASFIFHMHVYRLDFYCIFLSRWSACLFFFSYACNYTDLRELTFNFKVSELKSHLDIINKKRYISSLHAWVLCSSTRLQVSHVPHLLAGGFSNSQRWEVIRT